MASNVATTAAPTLPSDWRPSQSGCLKTDDLWIWDWGAGWDHTPTVLGGPAQTTECLPSGWDAFATFAASQCPPDYTSASCSAAATNSAVTCCPTAFQFQCLDSPVSGADAKGNVAYQRCVSRFTTAKTNLITWANLKLSTSSETMRSQHTYEHLFAGAIVYTTPTTTGTTATGSDAAVSSETSGSTATSAASSEDGTAASGGLSVGASAGIGVGVGVGVLLLLAALFLLFRRRKGRRAPPPPLVEAPGAPMHEPRHDYSHYADAGKPASHYAGGGYYPASPSAGGGGYYPASTPSPGLSTAPSSRSPPPPPHSAHAVVPGRHEMEHDPVPSELA